MPGPAREERQRRAERDRVDERRRRAGSDRRRQYRAPDPLGQVPGSHEPFATESVTERPGHRREQAGRHEQQHGHETDGRRPALVVGVDQDRRSTSRARRR